MIATRGGLAAPEAPFVIEHREALIVVAIPFATATIAAYLSRGGADAVLAAVVFQTVFEGMSVSFGLLFWWSIRHKHLKIALIPARARAAVIRFSAGNAAYFVAIAVAFLSAPASLLVSGLIAAYHVFEQTPARHREATDQQP